MRVKLTHPLVSLHVIIGFEELQAVPAVSILLVSCLEKFLVISVLIQVQDKIIPGPEHQRTQVTLIFLRTMHPGQVVY